MKLAVLLATFNRKEKTMACLDSLMAEAKSAGTGISVFLTDDASTDGTAKAVSEKYPEAIVLKGSGSLFWAGGMRNSWQEAVKGDFDFYLLLNDDTILAPWSLYRLLQYVEKDRGLNSIWVGSTADPETGSISYGGRKLASSKTIKSHQLFSEDKALECDIANANIMLVPRAVVEKIGILSDAYTHMIADLDYTLRAGKAGFKTFIVPGVSGYCTDDHGNNWKASSTSLGERISYLKSPKGLAYREYLHFIKEHFPWHLPAAFAKLWMKTLFPFAWDKFKVQNI